MHRIARIVVFFCLLVGVGARQASVAEGPARAVSPKPTLRDVTGKPFELPAVSAATFQAQVKLAGLLPRDEKPADFVLDLARAEGQWRKVTGHAINYNRSSHAVENTGLRATDKGLDGTVHVTINPDPWVPADGKKRDIEITLKDVTFGPADADGKRPVEGRYTATIAHPDGGKKDVNGKVTGVAAPFRLPGTWTMGDKDGKGIAFTFDMGTRRVNWNHQRSAVQELPAVFDLRGFSGLKCTVRTHTPRDDVNVTVWIREADGSWYYLRSAVPLVDKTNSAQLDFSDFAEAEWVAPGSHMDEDYVLDLAKISHLAIGVVNPLGVGKVAFTLESIELIPADNGPSKPAEVACTGRMLAVNDHDVVPAGLFGGFAGNMPQEYRPGCQRNLYARSYPRNPWQDWYKFHTSCFVDWKPLMKIFAGSDERHAKLVAYLHTRAGGGKYKRGFASFSLEKHLKGREKNISPSLLRSFLNSMLSEPNLYDADAWKGYDLPKDVVANATRDDRDDVEVYQYNRRLIEATFPKLILPRPDHGPAEMFYIECFGERKEPAWLVRDPVGWRDHFRHWARSLASNARDFQKYGEVVLEFWNEPYLHWGSKDKVNLKNHYFREDLARKGGPVALKLSPRFRRDHVKDWAALAAKSKAEGPVGQFLSKSLSRARAWDRFDPAGGNEPDAKLQEQVVRRLSDVLDSKDLPKLKVWTGENLPEQIEALRQEVLADKASKYELAVLNRSLLEAAMPGVFTENPALAEAPVVPHLKWMPDAKGNLEVVDETAFTDWSGKGTGWIYDTMYGVMASEVKKHNPEITCLAGWGFRWNEDHWAAWDLLYKNTIDRNIQWIDGIHEHHYQGDPTAMPGTYEVLTAYGVTRHDKWLYSYNTETNDLLDAPARGNVTSSAEARRATEYRRMSYNMRDILYCAYQTPDKARGRTMIHPTASPQALHVGYGLMRNLRGRLVECQTSDPDVWTVAAIDGTDPKAMPPGFDGQRLVFVVFNDHRHDRKVNVRVAAPTGTSFKDGRAEWTHVDKSDYQISRPGEDVHADGKKELTFEVTVQGRGAWKIELPLSGKVTKDRQVQRKQFFSPDILQTVQRDKPLKTAIQVDRAWLSGADKAWLKLVVEHVAPGEAMVKIGSAEIELPKAYTADNVTRILRIPVPLEALKSQTALEFSVRPGNHAGYRVDMVSLVVQRSK